MVDRQHAADVAVEQHARDRRAHLAGAEHDQVVDILAAARDLAAPVARGPGDAITTMRSPGSIASLPRGRISWAPRMMATTFESPGSPPRAAGGRSAAGAHVLRDVELDDLHLSVGEHVGLPRGGMPIRLETAFPVSSSERP